MDERPEDQDQTTERAVGASEGVRIIGAKEAADALESGDVEARLPEGAPRYGDRPLLPPPAPVLPPWTDPPTGEVPRVFAEGRYEGDASSQSGAEGGDDLDAWMGVSSAAPRWRDHPNDWDEPDYLDVIGNDEPRSGSFKEDSLRDQPVAAFDDLQNDDFGGTETAGQPDFFAPSFNPEPDRIGAPLAGAPLVQPPIARVERGTGTIGNRPGPGSGPGPAGHSGGSVSSDRLVNGYAQEGDRPVEADIRVRTITGIGVAAVALILFSMGPAMAMVAVLIVLVAAAAEFYGVLQRGGYQPATLLGLVATASMVLATYWKGTMALPLVMALTVVTALVWYLMGVTGGAPTLNAGVTVLGVGYVGVLGSFAALILRFDNGVGVLIGLILVVVANDVGALLVGKQFGTMPMAPNISPHKTREGLVGGALASVVVSVLALGLIGLHPWSVSSAILLGLVVSVLAPVGDLCESMIKRDIGVKDAGTLLPGHGGVLDRFDALLFVLPGVYYLCLLIEVF